MRTGALIFALAFALGTARAANADGPAVPAAKCPKVVEHTRMISILRAKSWVSLAAAWTAEVRADYPKDAPPVLARDAAVLRRQLCLPRAPDGTFVTDPNQAERLHAAGSCQGASPWLLAFGPRSALTVVVRDAEGGGLTAWVDAVPIPDALTGELHLEQRPEATVIRGSFGDHAERQVVAALSSSGRDKVLEISNASPLHLEGLQVKIDAPGCPKIVRELAEP
jgi:hypothetical protein